MASWEQTIDSIVEKLLEIYDSEFRGKKKGRFILTREQMKQALKVKRLHQSAIEKLQERALLYDLLIIDLDDLFPVIKADIVRNYRKPPNDLFTEHFPKSESSSAEDEAEDE